MTCFAVCAAMRPNSTDSIGPQRNRQAQRRVEVNGVEHAQLARGFFELRRFIGKNQPAPKRLVFAGLAIDCDAHFDVFAMRRRVATASAASIASKMISFSTPFSFETASTTIKISLLIESLPASCSNLSDQSCACDIRNRQPPFRSVNKNRHRLIVNLCDFPAKSSSPILRAR